MRVHYCDLSGEFFIMKCGHIVYRHDSISEIESCLDFFENMGWLQGIPWTEWNDEL